MSTTIPVNPIQKESEVRVQSFIDRVHKRNVDKIERIILEDLKDCDVSKRNHTSLGPMYWKEGFEKICSDFAEKGYHCKMKFRRSNGQFAYIIVSKYELRNNSDHIFIDEIIS